MRLILNTTDIFGSKTSTGMLRVRILILSHSPILYTHIKKGFLGVPRTLWVLSPSLGVTNHLTCNLSHFISIDLKTSYLLGFVRTFRFSLGNNKSAVATLV